MRLLSMIPFLVAAALTFTPASAQPLGCSKTFTVNMAKRAARSVYRGTRHVRRSERLMLGRIGRCQRNQAARPYVRWFYAKQREAWLLRIHPPCTMQLASWFIDYGATASGWHAYYGVANKWLPFGTKVQFRYHGRTVNAVVEDRGPYGPGRVWDLNQNVRAALGFDGVDYVCSTVKG